LAATVNPLMMASTSAACFGLVGQRDDGELDQVTLVARRRPGSHDHPEPTVHPLAVQIMAALDHCRREAVEVGYRRVQLMEVL
jgi:hypothetical protein